MDKVPLSAPTSPLFDPTSPLFDMLTQLYELRQKLGIQNQPEFATNLVMLDDIIKSEQYMHSFGPLGRSIFRKFNATGDIWMKGGQGQHVRDVPTKYYYRITDFDRLKSRCREKVTTARHGGYFYMVGEWNNNGKAWLKLSAYFQGWLHNKRGFSWWTSQEVLSKDDIQSLNDPAVRHKLIRRAHRTGLTNSDFRNQILLLRSHADNFRDTEHVRIPTVVDAYTSPIFQPMRTSENPTHGLTIDIGDLPGLTLTQDEFVLLSVDVEKIDVIPISIQRLDKRRHNVELNPILLEALINHYNKQCE